MDFSKVQNNRDANQVTRAFLDSIFVEPRYLDSRVPDLHFELWGKTFSSPIMIAAFSHIGRVHAGGMPEMARGAKAADIVNFAGMGHEDELGRILETGAATVKIIKPYKDRKRVYSLLKYAEEHGALAVGMDIDHSFDNKGMNDLVLGDEMAPVSAEELKDFVQAARLPFVVKGVMSVQDAEKSVKAGAKGLLISHHHGMMPCAAPPLMVLPRIRRAVGQDADLFVDCSIDTGADVFKCLAMGAKAACVGRCILPAFREEGAEGVRKYVQGMADELRGMMARTGSVSLNEIAKDVLWDADQGAPLRY